MARGRMIDRVIILSRKVNAISEGAENLYYRLNVCVDDFGRYHADPEIIKGQIYTKRRVSLSSIKSRLDELWIIGLVELYTNKGETYLEIVGFEDHQTFRSDIQRKAEYPVPKGFLQRPRNEPDTGRNEPDTKRALKLSKDKLSKDNVEPSSTILKIIEYFNETTGQKRSASSRETKGLISGRLNEGRTFDDFKHVIDTKMAQWITEPKMRAFIRPSTLFRPGNFEDYLNEPYRDPKRKEHGIGQTPQKYLIPVSADIIHDVRKALVEEANQKRLDEGKKTEILSGFFYRMNQIFKDPVKVEAWKRVPQNAESLLNFVRGTA